MLLTRPQLNSARLSQHTPTFGAKVIEGKDTQVQTVYKIKNRDGLYSPGGTSAAHYTRDWHPTKGKTWQGRGQIYNHLNQFHQGIPKDWVVERYEQTIVSRKMEETPATDFFANKIAEKKLKAAEQAAANRTARIHLLETELAELKGLPKPFPLAAK